MILSLLPSILANARLAPPRVTSNVGISPLRVKNTRNSHLLKRGHSHNDYHQQSPLFSSLRHGIKSIEVDVFCRKNMLLVGHTAFELDPKRTIDNIYIQPLLALLKKSKAAKVKTSMFNSDRSDAFPPISTAAAASKCHRNKNSIGPRKRISVSRPLINLKADDSITLLVDLKADADKSIALLHTALSPLKPYLSKIDEEGNFRQGRVTVLISGNRPSKEALYAPAVSRAYVRGGGVGKGRESNATGNKVCRANKERYLFIDGRVHDIRQRSDTSFVPLISIPWRTMLFARLTFRGEKWMQHMVREAHMQGKRLRIWGAPNAEKAWGQMMRSNVDLLSIDDHEMFADFASGYIEKME